MFLRLAATGATFFVLMAVPAWAEDPIPLPDSAPTPQATQNAPLDEPILDIADTPAGCAVLDKDFPGLRQHAMYDFFKSMTLNQIAALSKGQITQEMLAQAQADLATLSASNAPAAAAIPAGTTTVAATDP